MEQSPTYKRHIFSGSLSINIPTTINMEAENFQLHKIKANDDVNFT